MWLRNSRNQFIRSGFEHEGQNKEGEEYEEKRYLCANESWIDGWSGRMELSSVLLTASALVCVALLRVRLDGKLQWSRSI